MAIPGPGANEAQRPWNLSWFALSADGSRLVATPLPGRSGVIGTVVDRAGERIVELAEPLAYFIPEHVPDPSRRPAGEELWVEVTVPRAGAPRPIRLGVKKDGVLTPLND
jgi:hypothetical protein